MICKLQWICLLRVIKSRCILFHVESPDKPSNFICRKFIDKCKCFTHFKYSNDLMYIDQDRTSLKYHKLELELMHMQQLL